jgi:hypothetical protein
MFYKLVCKDITITNLYVGHTTDLKTRKSAHKTKCHNEKTRSYNIPVYKFIREHGGFENWDMIVIHRQNCVDKHEARTIERGFMESLGATLNSYMPIRTKAEWIEVRRQKNESYGESHTEEKKAYNLAYYIANKDKIKEQTAIYRDTHKEDAKNYQVLYNIANREKVKMQMKLYNEKNKDTIKAKRKLAYEKKKLLKQESLGVLI